MAQKLSLQITEIDNGFIIGVPPSAEELRAAQVSGRAPEGQAIYCEDFKQVCDGMRGLWPSEIKLTN